MCQWRIPMAKGIKRKPILGSQNQLHGGTLTSSMTQSMRALASGKDAIRYTDPQNSNEQVDRARALDHHWVARIVVAGELPANLEVLENSGASGVSSGCQSEGPQQLESVEP